MLKRFWLYFSAIDHKSTFQKVLLLFILSRAESGCRFPGWGRIHDNTVKIRLCSMTDRRLWLPVITLCCLENTEPCDLELPYVPEYKMTFSAPFLGWKSPPGLIHKKRSLSCFQVRCSPGRTEFFRIQPRPPWHVIRGIPASGWTFSRRLILDACGHRYLGPNQRTPALRTGKRLAWPEVS